MTTNQKYDAVVVGARCAGAATAMLLARRGYRVLLVDRAALPSDIPHGHFIHRHGPARLQQWGLLDTILATGCPPVTTITIDLGDFPLVGEKLEHQGVPLGVAPRRATLDRVLAEAAVGAGAELRDRFTVEQCLIEDGRVVGIVGRDQGAATTVTERAAMVVGADGRRSRVAKQVGAAVTRSAPVLTCWYFSYWSGASVPGLEVHAREGAVLFAFPTNDGLTGVFVGAPAGRLDAFRSDLEHEFMAAVDLVPSVSERVRSGRQEEPFRGATDLPNFYRKPFGAGWALVGDAGCHKDPFLALGICDAFRDAELLAEALDQGLSGRRGMEQALADYEARRDTESLPEYERNLARASWAPVPADLLAVRAAVRGDPEATRALYLATQGLVPPETFFNPANLQRVLGGTATATRPTGAARA